MFRILKLSFKFLMVDTQKVVPADMCRWRSMWWCVELLAPCWYWETCRLWKRHLEVTGCIELHIKLFQHPWSIFQHPASKAQSLANIVRQCYVFLGIIEGYFMQDL